ncbi:MAG: DMT family transporter [Bacteroidales bacterium]|nr:DMT family transporter [Bacteroidales bacterium]
MISIDNYYGELSALLTALFWTVTVLAFESASLKVGSLSVNVIRLIFGFIFLSSYTFIKRGLIFPADASYNNWLWLSLSGFIGFVVGDLFLLKSFTLIGSRFAMLIMTLVPPITALFGWIILDERLTIYNYLGMFLTFSGICMAIFSRENNNKKLSLKLAPKGLLFALAGALGQALGLVLSKFGMADFDPFAAAQIRIIAGITGFGILVSVLNRWNRVANTFKNKKGIQEIAIGSFFGPFLGVSFSLIAIKYTETGIASTIMAIVPILIIPPVILFYGQKVRIFEILGAIISVGGVAIFFII